MGFSLYCCVMTLIQKLNRNVNTGIESAITLFLVKILLLLLLFLLLIWLKSQNSRISSSKDTAQSSSSCGKCFSTGFRKYTAVKISTTENGFLFNHRHDWAHDVDIHLPYEQQPNYPATTLTNTRYLSKIKNYTNNLSKTQKPFTEYYFQKNSFNV